MSPAYVGTAYVRKGGARRLLRERSDPPWVDSAARFLPNNFRWSNHFSTWSREFSSRRPSMLWWLANLGAPHEARRFCSTCLLHRSQFPSCRICRFQDCHSETRFFDSAPPSKTNPPGLLTQDHAKCKTSEALASLRTLVKFCRPGRPDSPEAAV